MAAGLVEAALADLASLPSLLAAQESAGLQRDGCLASMFTAWAARFQALPAMSADEKTRLTMAIAGAPFTQEHRAELAELVMMGGSVERGCHSTKTQLCAHFENYILESEWLNLRARDAPRSLLVAGLAARAWHLNIYWPNPHLLLHMVRIIAYSQNNWSMSQDDISACMKQIQTSIKSRGRPRNTTLPVLMHFPVSAHELPEALRIHAYGASGPMPIVVDIPELGSILGGARMRRQRAIACLPSTATC